MRLVVFDVDGTLVDSQDHILDAMGHGFRAAGLTPPDRARVLSIVGLSLPVAVADLTPGCDAETRQRVTDAYRARFMQRRQAGPAPLYPGARACLDALARRDDLLLAVATGKSRRGLDAMIAAHDLQGMFVSLQTADTHPSKPHPSMLIEAMAATGTDPSACLMIGDTAFDMAMARAAGVTGIGVTWGYHPQAALREAGAARVVSDFTALSRAIEEWSA